MAEFNVPLSDPDGRMNNSLPQDVYPILDQPWIDSGRQIQNDVAVLRLGRNSSTGQYPGDVEGFFAVDFTYVLHAGDSVQKTGYGSGLGSFNATQWSTYGSILKTLIPGKPNFIYSALSSDGDSGSSVILADSNKIIGVHNASSADQSYGTMLGAHPGFQEAIKSCLEWEKTLEPRQ